MPGRTDTFLALFALTADMVQSGQGFAPFVSRSRKFKHFAKVPAEQQPAFFQTEHTERTAERTNMPAKRVWSQNWVVYFRTDPGDEKDLGADLINDWLDAFEARLKPVLGQPSQTLGGRVHHAFIDGEILKVPGDDEGQGMLVVPITILVP